MRNILSVISVLLFFALTGFQVFSQAAAPAPGSEQKWMRVQSDNGEFSIEVPDEYDYFFDKDGFSVTYNANDYRLTDVSIFNSYRKGVLLSFDSYKTNNSKDALKALISAESRDEKAEKVKIGDKVFYQMIVRNEKYYLIRQYFATKEYVYILTAAARKEGAEEIDRFLKSRTISGYSSPPVNAVLPVVPMSALRPRPLALEDANAEDDRSFSSKKMPPKPPQPDVDKYVILIKPRASYVDPARQANERGNVTLRISFTTQGGVSRIEVLRKLGNGLLRQTALTALRVKYLPKEVNGTPVSATVTIEYGFDSY